MRKKCQYLKSQKYIITAENISIAKLEIITYEYEDKCVNSKITKIPNFENNYKQNVPEQITIIFLNSPDRIFVRVVRVDR